LDLTVDDAASVVRDANDASCVVNEPSCYNLCMQFSLRRLFYFVALSCLIVKAVTLLPYAPDYPELYVAVCCLIFAAIFYELNRVGINCWDYDALSW